jgi:hypothetical protein
LIQSLTPSALLGAQVGVGRAVTGRVPNRKRAAKAGEATVATTASEHTATTRGKRRMRHLRVGEYDGTGTDSWSNQQVATITLVETRKPFKQKKYGGWWAASRKAAADARRRR